MKGNIWIKRVLLIIWTLCGIPVMIKLYPIVNGSNIILFVLATVFFEPIIVFYPRRRKGEITKTKK